MLPNIQPGRSVLQCPQTNPERTPRHKHCDDGTASGLSTTARRVNKRMDTFLEKIGPTRYTTAYQQADLLDEEVDINRFDEIVKQIDELNGKGQKEIVLLTKGQGLEDFCVKNRSKTYKMSLPSKPIQMNIEVIDLGYKEGPGSATGSIAVYASVETERPSRRAYQHMGTSSVEHVHAFLSGQVGGEDGNPIDRRKIAPPHKWLYISVECAWGDCKYRIRGTCSPVTIQLTKRELTYLNAQTKTAGGVERKIEEIKQDEHEMSKLEERCRKHRKRLHGDKNLVESNKDVENQVNPKAKYMQTIIKKVQKCQREDQVLQRKTDELQAKVQRAEEWVCGPERRAQRRAEEEKQRQYEENCRQRIRMWQVFLALHTSVCTTAEKLEIEKVKNEELRKANCAANIIQRVYLHVSYARRRVRSYSNVTRFRVGMVTYIRQMRLQTFLAAGNCLGHSLRNSFIEYSLDVRTAIKKLRWSVLMVQRHWTRLKMIRRSRVEVYGIHFRDMERSIRAGKSGKSFVVPDEVMEHVLLDLVKTQQERWVEAVRMYQDRDGLMTDEQAAVAFLTEEGDAKLALGAPQSTSFLLQKGQLEELVTATHDRFKAGDFAELLESMKKQSEIPGSPKDSQQDGDDTPGNARPNLSGKKSSKQVSSSRRDSQVQRTDDGHSSQTPGAPVRRSSVRRPSVAVADDQQLLQ